MSNISRDSSPDAIAPYYLSGKELETSHFPILHPEQVQGDARRATKLSYTAEICLKLVDEQSLFRPASAPARPAATNAPSARKSRSPPACGRGQSRFSPPASGRGRGWVFWKVTDGGSGLPSIPFQRKGKTRKVTGVSWALQRKLRGPPCKGRVARVSVGRGCSPHG